MSVVAPRECEEDVFYWNKGRKKDYLWKEITDRMIATERPSRMEELSRAAVLSSSIPVTLKTRTGVGKHELSSLKLFPQFAK